jgi:hypothetical protein
VDNPKRSSLNWLVVICIILSIALVPIILSRALWDTSLMSALSERSVQVVRLANLVQIVLSLPLGLVDMILAYSVLLKRPSSRGRTTAITSIVIGVLGILTGFSWLLLLSGVFGQVY